MSDLKILIIIPAYNEEASVSRVISRVKAEIPGADILLVNDGSTDNTSSIARSHSGVMVVDLPFNLGIGGAMQTGYIYAYRNGYDIAVQIDADGQHDPAFVHQLMSPILKGDCDMTIGSRYVTLSSYKSSIGRRLGILFFSFLVSFITRQRVKDTTSGFRAVSARVIELFANQYPADYPEVDVLVRLYRNGFKFREIPVEMNKRQGGTSSITPVRSVYYMVKVSLALLVNLVRTR